jgi:hypothetical protein
MTYSERVKASRVVTEKINSLAEGDSYTFKYRGIVYVLDCYSISHVTGRRSYSVNKVGTYGTYGSGMNIEKIGPTSLSLYTFDMMEQKTTYKMDMSLMEEAFTRGV